MFESSPSSIISGYKRLRNETEPHGKGWKAWRSEPDNSMEDVIERSGYAFGTNEAIMLSQLSLAAIPTAMAVLLELVTIEKPEVCLVGTDGACVPYEGDPLEVCFMTDTDWNYVRPFGTVISNYDLLCNSTVIRRLPQLVFYAGMFISCFLAGFLSDLIGRKLSLLAFLLLEGVFIGLLIVMTSFSGYCTIRFFSGLCVGYFVVCKTLIVEGLKVEYRHSFLAAIWSSFAVGIMLLGLLNFFFERYIDILAIIVILIYVLWAIYLFGIQESLRWLLVKRKKEEAVYILHKIAYLNNVELPAYDEIPIPVDDKYHLKDIFIIKKSRWLMLILLQLSTVSFYMLDDYTQSAIDSFITSNKYRTLGFSGSEEARSVDLILSGIVFLMGVLVASFSCRILGRRPTTILEVTVCWVALIMLLCTSEWTVVTASSYMIRSATPGLLYVTSLYSLEAFITPLRARAVGLVVSGAALGGILSAVKSFYKIDFSFTITVIELVVVSYLWVISLCLEETKGRSLPDGEADMPGVTFFKDMCRFGGEEGAPLLQENGNTAGKVLKDDSEESTEID